MRLKIILIALPFLLVSQAATADIVSECSPIKKASARLACYDKSAPAAKTDVKSAKPEFSDVANPFSAEDARTTARLKGICRGC